MRIGFLQLINRPVSGVLCELAAVSFAGQVTGKLRAASAAH
jgi:hypothetical protein